MADDSVPQDSPPPARGLPDPTAKEKGASDEILFETLQQELKGAAVRLAARFSPGRTFGATELLHEVFVRLNQAGRTEWADPLDLKRFAFRVMFHFLQDYAEKMRPERRDHEELDRGFGRSAADPNDTLALLDALIEMDREPKLTRLSKVYKAYCFLTHQFRFSRNGMEMIAEAAPGECRTFAEIGQILEIPTATAHLRYKQACQWLEQRLGDSYPERRSTNDPHP